MRAWPHGQIGDRGLGDPTRHCPPLRERMRVRPACALRAPGAGTAQQPSEADRKDRVAHEMRGRISLLGITGVLKTGE